MRRILRRFLLALADLLAAIGRTLATMGVTLV